MREIANIMDLCEENVSKQFSCVDFFCDFYDVEIL